VPSSSIETRVLVLAPTGLDAQVTLRVLGEAHIDAVICASESDLLREVRRGAGAVLLTDDFMHREPLRDLHFLLELQPAWSELPVLVLARPDARRPETFRSMGGVVMLERPMHVRTLVSAVQAAVRARLRQYELRNQLEQTHAMNRELERAARAKDDFLATLSHELRNPLGALSTAAKLLDRPGIDAASAATARAIVNRQATQMTRLLDDLLDVARVTRGRLEIRKAPASLRQIVSAAVEMVQPLIVGKRHSFDLRVPEQDSNVEVDAVRLAQVMANLLGNAAKYTEPGGHLELSVERIAREIVIKVRDNGIGIAQESFSDIFGMFSQLRPALDRSEGGLGIGLALSRGLVELHGGAISVASDGPGRGSEFTVRVPLQAAGPAQPEATTVDEPSGCGCELIVADDNADGLHSLAALLELEGFGVRTAQDGPAALALFEAQPPAAMLLDIGMPGMNGYEVARRIRAHPAGKPIKLIAITGWGQPADRRQADEAGFDFHLTKPVDFRELLPMLADSLMATCSP